MEALLSVGVGERGVPGWGGAAYRPRRRFTCFVSAGCTSAPRPRRRLRAGLFFSRMWLRKAFRRRILPDPVTLNRLAAPLSVFIFGMSSGFLAGRLSPGCGCAVGGWLRTVPRRLRRLLG